MTWVHAATDATEAVASAYREHGSAVYGLALSLCGPIGAQDVTQEVFLELWRNPERYISERGTLRAFLLTMAHNRAVDLLRSTEARRRREVRSISGAAVVEVGVDEQIENIETGEQVLLALQTLPPREKEAIVTAFYGACSYSEAALVLSVPEGTTKSRIRSGLRRLALSLEDTAGVGSS